MAANAKQIKEDCVGVDVRTVWEGYVRKRRVVGFVDSEGQCFIVPDHRSLYGLLRRCIDDNVKPKVHLSSFTKLKPICAEEVAVRFRTPALPHNPLHVFVSGVGHTHVQRVGKVVGDGRDESVQLVQPEWFYKGNGIILKTTEETLMVPRGAWSGVEEAELVLVYLVDGEKWPHYIGYTIGNEFSDTDFGKAHRHYFAQSKLLNCSVAPEIVLAAPPSDITIEIEIHRSETLLWRTEVSTGSQKLLFSVPEIEKLLFKHQQFLRPGMMHYLYLGTYKSSYQDGIRLEQGDRIEMRTQELRWSLVNRVNSPLAVACM